MLASREAVDDQYAELAAADYRGRQPPFDASWGARYAIVADPDGNDVGLMSPVEDSRRAGRRSHPRGLTARRHAARHKPGPTPPLKAAAGCCTCSTSGMTEIQGHQSSYPPAARCLARPSLRRAAATLPADPLPCTITSYPAPTRYAQDGRRQAAS